MITRTKEIKPQCPEDTWTPEGFFIHYGKKYAVDKNLKTGVVAEKPEPEKLPPETTPKAPQTLPAPKILVSKLPDKAITLPQIQKAAVLKHPGGRPRKKDADIESRVTHWRRRKEKSAQGVLL